MSSLRLRVHINGACMLTAYIIVAVGSACQYFGDTEVHPFCTIRGMPGPADLVCGTSRALYRIYCGKYGMKIVRSSDGFTTSIPKRYSSSSIQFNALRTIYRMRK